MFKKKKVKLKSYTRLLIVLCILEFIQNSFTLNLTWSASKSRRSDAAITLSHQKLEHRCEELEVCPSQSTLPTEIKQNQLNPSLAPPYDQLITHLRDDLGPLDQPHQWTDSSLEQAEKLYMTPPSKVYSGAVQFITRHSDCADQASLSQDGASFDKKQKLQSVLQAIENLSSTQKALKNEMGDRSIKNGSADLQKMQDTNRIGNIPHPKFTVERPEQGTLSVLRMGSQTIDIPKKNSSSGQRESQVAPEFAAFIERLKRQSQNQPHPKQHVYVNLQMTVNRGGVFGLFGGGFGDFKKERLRAEALHAFSRERGDELVMISLDKNSHFYQFFPPTGSSESIIQTLADRFFPESDDIEQHWLKTGINLSDLWTKNIGHCPQHPRDQALINACKMTLKRKFLEEMKLISKDFFGSDAHLNRAQSKAFLDLSYQYIINLATHNATSMNASCKSGVDRAGGVNANYYLLSLMKNICDGSQAQSNDIDQKINDLRHVFFSDAVLYNGRPVNDDRLKRFQDSAQWMIRGALTQLQNNGNTSCLTGSKNLLFSGTQLSNELTSQVPTTHGCLSRNIQSNCSEEQDPLGSGIYHLGEDLSSVRGFLAPLPTEPLPSDTHSRGSPEARNSVSDSEAPDLLPEEED